jgi:hypothetical protein
LLKAESCLEFPRWGIVESSGRPPATERYPESDRDHFGEISTGRSTLDNTLAIWV